MTDNRITERTLVSPGGSLYDEGVTRISITDEGGGEFLVVSQSTRAGLGEIRINREEVPAFVAALQEMANEIRSEPTE
ncbi:MAG: hypothetical protein AAFU38_16195 [Bacteroidota bacterium]